MYRQNAFNNKFSNGNYNNNGYQSTQEYKQPKAKKVYEYWSLLMSKLPSGEAISESLIHDWTPAFTLPQAVKHCYVAIDRRNPEKPQAILQFVTNAPYDKSYINEHMAQGYWAVPYISATGDSDDEMALFNTAVLQVNKKLRLSNNHNTAGISPTANTDIAICRRKLQERETLESQPAKVAVGCVTRVETAMGKASSAWSCASGDGVKQRPPAPKRSRAESSESASVEEPKSDEIVEVPLEEEVSLEDEGAGVQFLRRRRQGI